LESLSKNQTFSPNWPDLDLIRAEYSPNGEKKWFSSTGSRITSLSVQIPLINLNSCVNWKV